MGVVGMEFRLPDLAASILTRQVILAPSLGLSGKGSKTQNIMEGQSRMTLSLSPARAILKPCLKNKKPEDPKKDIKIKILQA